MCILDVDITTNNKGIYKSIHICVFTQWNNIKLDFFDWMNMKYYNFIFFIKFIHTILKEHERNINYDMVRMVRKSGPYGPKIWAV